MLNTYESAIDYLDNLYEEKVSKEKAGAIAAATAGALVVTGLTALTLKKICYRVCKFKEISFMRVISGLKLLTLNTMESFIDI